MNVEKATSILCAILDDYRWSRRLSWQVPNRREYYTGRARASICAARLIASSVFDLSYLPAKMRAELARNTEGGAA